MKKVKSELKRSFKAYPILYRAWFILNRNRLDSTVRLPNKSDHYFFDGYPRSGNTFFRGLLKYALPDLQGASHLHIIAGVKIALRRSLKTLIIIRNPKDAILSNAYTKIHRNRNPVQSEVNKVIEGEINEWIDYYHFVLMKYDVVMPIIFERVINNESAFLNRLEVVFGKDIRDKEKVIEHFKERMRLGESKKEIAYSSLPNKQRVEFKKKFAPQVEQNCRYAEALELYNSISDLS